MFTVLSLFAAYLFLLGCACAPPRRGVSILQQLALTLTAGILIDYLIVLTGMELSAALLAGSVVAFAGAVRLRRGLARHSHETGLPTWRREWPWLACAVVVLAIYYFQILAEPLFHWDARSIWFFHSKMIWIDGALRARGGWGHPSIAFSHPDYPNLVPSLGAQLAHLKGYWNEFLPKGSLWLVLVPLVLWVFSIGRASAGFLLLVLLYFFSLHAWLWNGYMDAYVAMYAGVALLWLGRFAGGGRDVDLYSGVCALGIAASLKNEGLLFAICALIVVALAGFFVPAFNVRALAALARMRPMFLGTLFVSAAPPLLWSIHKTMWNLESFLLPSLSEGVGRAAARVRDGEALLYMLRVLGTRATVSWLLLGLIAAAVLATRVRRGRVHPGVVISLAATALYFAGVTAAYLVTPADVTWHLLTSATRVMATVSFGLLISLFFLMSGLECGQPADRGSAAGPPQSARSEIESAARPSGTS